jgi:hypothetical protein
MALATQRVITTNVIRGQDAEIYLIDIGSARAPRASGSFVAKADIAFIAAHG